MDDVVPMLKKFGTSQNTLAISGTDSAGMESGLSSLLEPGDQALMWVYGFFCERMVDMVERIRDEVIPIRADWGNPFPEELLEKGLRTHTDVKSGHRYSRGTLDRSFPATGISVNGG